MSRMKTIFERVLIAAQEQTTALEEASTIQCDR